MNLLLDENIPRSAVKELRALGIKVEHASEIGLKGAIDKEIAAYAKKQDAILITKDLEFGSLLVYPKGSHYGLIVLRVPHHLTAQHNIKILKNFLQDIKTQNLAGKIIVLELGRYRTRDTR